MMITQTLLQCERCSVLLVDPTSKVSMVMDRKVGVYIATKLFQFTSHKEPYTNLAGSDSFFQPCLGHCIWPSYGDFLNCFVMKVRAGPYKSYDNSYYCDLAEIVGKNCTSNVQWKLHVHGVIGFGVASHWLKYWPRFLCQSRSVQ